MPPGASSPSPTRRPGRPKGPRPDPGARRALLLAAARRAIASVGPDASMADIAAASGYSKPALYAVFSDKGALADSLGAQVVLELVGEIGPVPEGEPPSPVHLHRVIDAYCRFVESEPALFRFLVQGAAGFGRTFESRTLPVAVGTSVAALLAAGLEANGADPAPATTWGYAMMGAVFMAADAWVDRRPAPREVLVDQLTAFVWGGLAGGLPGGRVR